MGKYLDILESWKKDQEEPEREVMAEEEVDESRFKKVVRGGKVKKKRIPIRKKRMSPAQKRALKKARRFAHKGGAKRKRKKSVAIRKRRIRDSGIDSGVSCLVKNGLEIVMDSDNSISVKPGSLLSFEAHEEKENYLIMDVFDEEGELVEEGLEVTDDFITTCFEEDLIESLSMYEEYYDEDDEEEISEELEESEEEEDDEDFSEEEDDDEVNESKEPAKKDRDRIESMIRKAKGNPAKIGQYAFNMAKSIKEKNKAYRRAEACREAAQSGSISNEMKRALEDAADLFMSRYNEL